jgi:hypothetical protein
MAGQGHKLSSVFYRRGDLLEYIRAGASFRRVHSDRTVETAQVLGLYVDLYGIPHITFDLSIERPGRGGYKAGSRTMALKVFCENYGERRKAVAVKPAGALSAA